MHISKAQNIDERNQRRPETIETFTMFMDWKIQHLLRYNSLQTDYRFNPIQIKTPARFFFFCRYRQADSKIYMER